MALRFSYYRHLPRRHPGRIRHRSRNGRALAHAPAKTRRVYLYSSVYTCSRMVCTEWRKLSGYTWGALVFLRWAHGQFIEPFATWCASCRRRAFVCVYNAVGIFKRGGFRGVWRCEMCLAGRAASECAVQGHIWRSRLGSEHACAILGVLSHVLCIEIGRHGRGDLEAPVGSRALP